MVASASLLATFPWEVKPYLLWSLLDIMKPFEPRFTKILCDLTESTTQLRFHRAMELSAAFSSFTGFQTTEEDATANKEKVLGHVRANVLALRDETATLGLHSTISSSLTRLYNVTNAVPRDISIIEDRLSEVLSNLFEELGRQQFFAVAPQRQEYYKTPMAWFGAEVPKQFSESSLDIRDACQCFAFAQWTASVFHSMRILERGLVYTASELGIADVGLENWNTIIERIEAEIKAMERQRKSQEKPDAMEFYSRAAITFTYFKDAWRNHVSHSRQSYDEQEAEIVLRHTKDFMRQLAEHKKATP